MQFTYAPNRAAAATNTGARATGIVSTGSAAQPSNAESAAASVLDSTLAAACMYPDLLGVQVSMITTHLGQLAT